MMFRRGLFTTLYGPVPTVGSMGKRTAGFAAAAMIALAGCGDDSTTGPEPLGPTPEPEPGMIQTWAGTGQAGFNGNGLHPLESRLYFPMDVCVARNGDVYVMDWNNHQIRVVDPDYTFRTIMGEPIPGDGPLDLSDRTQPGAPGPTVRLNHPTDMIELPDGTFLHSAWHTHKLRHYDPSTGLVYVYCGGPAGFAGDGQDMSKVKFNQPPHTVLAPDGSFFIMDQRNQRIRKIDPNNVVTTVVGNPVNLVNNDTGLPPADNFMDPGFSGDGGPPDQAMIGQPGGGNPPPGGALTLDDNGRLYFCDILNNRIRRVDFQANTIETVIGNGAAMYAGDGGQGVAASLNNPRDVEFGPDGLLYIADELNHAVRAWDPATGIIKTVAGTGVQGFSGDGGPATAAQLNRPSGVEFGPNRVMYIADSYNHRVRRMKLEGN